MDSLDFKKSFLEEAKSSASISGEGTCAAFVENMASYLMDAEVLDDFTPSFYVGTYARTNLRVDGYNFDEFDNTMNIIVAAFDGINTERSLTNTEVNKIFNRVRVFINSALNTDFYLEVEFSTPVSDLIDMIRERQKDIRRYKVFILTDAVMSQAIKTISIEDVDGVPIEGQIWDIERLYRVCCSDQGRQTIEIDFTEYTDMGIPCIEASSASTDQYKSYLGVIPGTVLADIYDKYGSKLLEGNVRSFLSSKVAVNKKIRATILNEPDMFFAYNNGVSSTATNVKLNKTENGCFITYAEDFQIINGGQTTASISTARYKDKAKIDDIFVQIKITSIDKVSQEESDELIRNISRSSNSQNKVSDADFFAAHPFHRRMEQISRVLFAPAKDGEQYETKWFYERARGQYLQEQIRLTPAKKKQYLLQHPKNQLVKKTDLSKVRNAWAGNPHIVSKGAQTNFNSFAEWINSQWESNDTQFNELYYQETISLIIIFQYLEKYIPKQSWYEGGYRANIIYYTVALFHKLIKDQFPGYDLDLIAIWSKQGVPDLVGEMLLKLAKLTFESITDPSRKEANVTQWCKKIGCWEAVKKISMELPTELNEYLISNSEKKSEQKSAKNSQKMTNELNAEIEVIKYTGDQWKSLQQFLKNNNVPITESDYKALIVACQIPFKLPNSRQANTLLALLKKANEEGFSF